MNKGGMNRTEKLGRIDELKSGGTETEMWTKQQQRYIWIECVEKDTWNKEMSKKGEMGRRKGE